MSLVVTLIELAAALAALGLALQARDPILAQYRPWGSIAAIGLGLSVLIAVWRSLVRRGPHNGHGHALLAIAGVALFSIMTTITAEGRYLVDREKVKAASPEQLASVGRHLIVGYIDFKSVRALVEKKAIGGIFLSKRNVAGKSLAEVSAEIASLQAIRRSQGLPPLWVTADQEGGYISHLSPPLAHRPSLGDIVRGSTDPRERALAVEQMASEQGRELARLGVTLNLAPVVDLDINTKAARDGLTKLGRRVISSDPEVVASTASRYCTGLAESGVLCAVKHFPGLGRARGDTHRGEVKLNATMAELEAADWVPFMRVAPLRTTVVMVGHVRAMSIDPDAPASLSRFVITSILRNRLGHEGLVMTDDLCMRAVTNIKRSVGSAAVEALNAGADLLLVSWDSEQIYPVLSHLMAAAHDGRLDPAMLARSNARLDSIAPRLAASP